MKEFLVKFRIGSKALQMKVFVEKQDDIFKKICDLIMIDCMERIADKTDIPADQARALIAELPQHTDATPWIRTMDAERVAEGLWCYQTLQHGSLRNLSLLSNDTHIPPLLDWAWKYPCAPILKKDFTVYLKLMSQLQDYYKVPYYQVAATIREHPILTRQIPYIFTGLLLVGDQIVTRTAEHDAAVDVARVGLGLKLFKQKNGAYPDTLDKLAPEFINNIPIDLFTGKPLVYHKADAGFILYSLGPNQQDDNGTPPPPTRDVWGPYDIVWKSAR